jgi:hypothetical protein
VHLVELVETERVLLPDVAGQKVQRGYQDTLNLSFCKAEGGNYSRCYRMLLRHTYPQFCEMPQT